MSSLLDPAMMGGGAPMGGAPAGGEPDLSALLGGGGGAPPGGAPQLEAPPELEEPGADITSSPRGDNTDNLREAIASIRLYLEGEQDDEDLAAGSDIVAKLQKLLAAQQKLEDTATGAGAGAKFVRKQTQAAGGGGGY